MEASLKRSLYSALGGEEDLEDVHGKAAKVDMGFDDSMEGWICPDCGNHNYPGRVFCNMRRCGKAKPGSALASIVPSIPQALGGFNPAAGAPPGAVPAGSWTCSSCGNVNWPNRAVCNGLKGQCGKAPDEGEVSLATSILQGVAAAVQSRAGGAAARGGAMRLGALSLPTPEGSWVCLACQNINYPTRTACNGRGCGRPREEVDGGPPGDAMPAQAPARLPPAPARAAPFDPGAPNLGNWICLACRNVNFPYRSSCNGRSCGLPRSEVDGGPPDAHETAAAAAAAQVPKVGVHLTDWVCLACNNVNRGHRSACNGRSCGRPREEVDGGPPSHVVQAPPPQAPAPLQAAPPPGDSWVCASCGNLNFPHRESCNGRGCGLPRAEADSGPPQPQQLSARPAHAQEAQPDGSWICPACQNLNWPNRLVCNARGCGLPKPEEIIEAL